MHAVESGRVSALRKVCERSPLETAQITVFDLWVGNVNRLENLKAALNEESFGSLFAIDQGASLLSCTDHRLETLAFLRSLNFPRFHAFQKLVSAMYRGEMVERINAIQDWAMYAEMTVYDNVGSVTIAEQ